MTKCPKCGFKFVPDRALTKAVVAACPCGEQVTIEPTAPAPVKPSPKKEA